MTLAYPELTAERAAWLAALQPKDEVAVVGTYVMRAALVESLSDFGTVCLTDLVYLTDHISARRTDGVLITFGGFIEPITDAHRQFLLAGQLRNADWAALPLETLRHVLYLIDPSDPRGLDPVAAAAPDPAPLIAALRQLVAMDNGNYQRETMRSEGAFDQARAALLAELPEAANE